MFVERRMIVIVQVRIGDAANFLDDLLCEHGYVRSTRFEVEI